MSDSQSSVYLRALGTRDSLAGDPNFSLDALDTTILKTGAMVFVTEVRAYYQFFAEDDASADGLSIVEPANGPGRWHRMPYSKTIWAAQAAWFIDPLNGDDTAQGDTPATAIRTGAELTERISTAFLTQATTITWLNDAPSTDYFAFFGTINLTSPLILKGTPTTLSGPHVVSAITNLSVGTTLTEVTVTGFDWTSFVGKRCRITATSGSTPVGTTFWVEAVDSGDSQIGIVSRPRNSNTDFVDFGQQDLAVGDTFVIEELTAIGQMSIYGANVQFRGGNFDVLFEDVKLESRFDSDDMNSIWLFGSEFACNNINHGRSILQAFGCAVKDGPFTGSRWVNQEIGALLTCSIQVTGGRLEVSDGGILNVFANSSLRGGAGVLVVRTASLRVDDTGGFSMNEWSGPAIDMREGTNAFLEGLVWGSSAVASTYGFRVAGAKISYDPSVTPTVFGTLQGSGRDVRVGGVDSLYAALPVIEANNDAFVEYFL